MSKALSRRLAAVWFADLVAYTTLASEDEESALALVRDFQAAAREAVEAEEGRVVKFVGDAALAEFGSAMGAVRAGLALQASLGRRLSERGAPSRTIRVGIHVGEVARTADGDLLGDGVNVASRLQGAAEPGQVLLSEDAARPLRALREVVLEPAGERRLKGLAEPVRVWLARPEGVPAAPTAARAPERPPGRPADDGDRRSIAVLPFANMSPDPGQEYFSDGMTEEILTALARIEDLKVISRTSVMRYKGTTKSLREIGEELGVSTILEGSVRHAGSRVRITAQLVDARSDDHLWAESWDRELEDIFAIQADVAERIVEALRGRLTPGERARLEGRPTDSLEAYQAYLRGLHFSSRRTVDSLQRALAEFEAALAEDPEYAPAWAGRAAACCLQLAWGRQADPAARDRALEAAERAIEIAPDLGLAYAVRAQVRQHDRDWAAAGADFERAVEAAPGDATVRQWYAQHLASMGRLGEAFAQIERARELDPHSLAVLTEEGNVRFFARRFDEAEELYRQALDLDPAFYPARWKLFELACHLGRVEEAIDLAERQGAFRPEQARELRERAAAGDPAPFYEAFIRYGDEKGWSRYFAAVMYGYLGRIDEALETLRRARDEGDWYLVRVAVSPHSDPLRGDPRFAAFLEEIGLADVPVPEAPPGGPAVERGA